MKDDSGETIEVYLLPVSVLSVAEVPSVDATESITVTGGATNPLMIVVENSKDQSASDNSERLCVLLAVANDANGDPIGTILINMVPGITVSTTTEGTYLVEVSGDTPNAHESLLNDFFSSGLEFEASMSSVGVFPEGIRVEAVSKEDGPAAPSNSQVDGTLGDIDTSTEADTVFVAVEIVAPSPISSPMQAPASVPTTAAPTGGSAPTVTSPTGTQPTVGVPAPTVTSPTGMQPTPTVTTPTGTQPTVGVPAPTGTQPTVGGPTPTVTSPTVTQPTMLSPANLVEDVSKNIGPSISNPIDSSTSTVPIASVCLEGLPEGSFVQYPVPNSPGTMVTTSVGSVDSVIRIAGDSEDEILQSLSELVVRAPEDSDEDFQITATVKDDSDETIEVYLLPVSVLSVADVPSVDATESITVTGGATNPLMIVVENSKDQSASDNSERLCVLLTVANDANGDPIGTILTSMVPGITVSTTTEGTYLVEVSGDTPNARESLLNDFFLGGLEFQASTSSVGQHQLQFS